MLKDKRNEEKRFYYPDHEYGRRYPICSGNVYGAITRMGRNGTGRCHRHHRRCNPAGHDSCPPEDGWQTRHCFQWEGYWHHPVGCVRGHCPWRGHVHDHGLEHDDSRYHRWYNRHHSTALPHSRGQGLEIRRKSYDKMDFFDHSWRHSIGRTSNRREVFCSQT